MGKKKLGLLLGALGLAACSSDDFAAREDELAAGTSGLSGVGGGAGATAFSGSGGDAGSSDEPSSGEGGESAGSGSVTASAGESVGASGGFETGGTGAIDAGGTAGAQAGSGSGGTGMAGSLTAAGTGGAGGTISEEWGPCPNIEACAAEPHCLYSSNDCGSCEMGVYNCGEAKGLHTTLGDRFPCEDEDCLDAIAAANERCTQCQTGVGGSAGVGGSSAGVGGAGASAGSGGSYERCPMLPNCAGNYSCTPITTGCSACDVDRYVCDLAGDSYEVHRKTTGETRVCTIEDCTSRLNEIYDECCN